MTGLGAALRYEWLRLTTLRSTWWLTGLAALLGLGVAALIAQAAAVEFGSGSAASPQDRRLLPGAIVSQGASVFAPYLLGYVVAMIGVFAWGHEYRHGMIRATLTAAPRRTSVWVAKFAVVGAWALAVSLLTGLGCLLLGQALLSGTGVGVIGTAGIAMVLRCALYALVLTWVMTAFAALVRQQVAALVLMFLWPFLVENLIQGVVNGVPSLADRLGGAVRFLPFDAGTRMLRQVSLFSSQDALSPTQGLAVVGGFGVLLMVASLVLFHRRDA